jgi:muconate cycloisomerase
MKVEAVQLTPVQTWRRTGTRSAHVILQLFTDANRVGLGEISDLDLYRMYMPDLEAVRAGLEEVVVGRDPFEITGLHAALERYMPHFTSKKTYPPFNPPSQIAAGVEMACYDLAGKNLGTPVYNLLGGKTRDALEVTYPIFQAKEASDYDRYLGYMEELMEEGLDRFRYYVGVDFDKDERFLSAVRDRFGEDARLKALDFQHRFYWKDALRACRRLAPYGFDLIESPTRNEDYDSLAALRGRVDVDVSEHVSSTAQAMRMIEKGAVDVFNVSVVSGGLQLAQKLFGLAEAAGLKSLMGTTQELSIATAAMAHLGAALPELHYAGDPVGPLLYTEDVVAEPVRYEGSRLVVPDGPGLGVELDEGKLDALEAPLVEWERPAHGADYVSD